MTAMLSAGAPQRTVPSQRQQDARRIQTPHKCPALWYSQNCQAANRGRLAPALPHADNIGGPRWPARNIQPVGP